MTQQVQIEHDFDQQAQTLINKGFPAAAKITEAQFFQLLEPLRQNLSTIEAKTDIVHGKLAFVIVVTSQLVPSEVAMSLVKREGKQGTTKLFPHQPIDFSPIDSVTIPLTPAYLLVDVDRGHDTLNQPPSLGLKAIEELGRTPLTIDEGIAIVTHCPEFLAKNNCFYLSASRHPGDKRVPAIWINAKKQPNLGWCWAQAIPTPGSARPRPNPASPKSSVPYVWAPSYENYTLTPVDGGTNFAVDMDIDKEYYDQLYL